MVLVPGIDEDRDLHGAHLCIRTALHRIERPARAHRDARLLGEHFFKDETVHLWLGLRAAHRFFHLQRVRPVDLAIVRLDALRDFQKRARETFKGPKIGVGEPIRHQPADPRIRLHEQHVCAVFRRRQGRGNSGRSAAVNEHIVLLCPEPRRGEEQHSDEVTHGVE